MLSASSWQTVTSKDPSCIKLAWHSADTTILCIRILSMGVKSSLETQLRPPSQFWTRSDFKWSDSLGHIFQQSDSPGHIVLFIMQLPSILQIMSFPQILPYQFIDAMQPWALTNRYHTAVRSVKQDAQHSITSSAVWATFTVLLYQLMAADSK